MEGVGAWATKGRVGVKDGRRAGRRLGFGSVCVQKHLMRQHWGFCHKMAKSGKFGLLRVFLPVFCFLVVKNTKRTIFILLFLVLWWVLESFLIGFS